MQQGDYSDAMKASQCSVVRDIHDSLPARSMSMLTMEDKASLFSKTDAAEAASLVTSKSVLN